jgi:hypothetical protein
MTSQASQVEQQQQILFATLGFQSAPRVIADLDIAKDDRQPGCFARREVATLLEALYGRLYGRDAVDNHQGMA